MTFEEFLNKYQRVPVDFHPNRVPKEPVVSVCVQTYQHVNYIRQCLDGILKQETDFSFEILLGEDDSKDGTREICLEYANRYPDKIRLFLHRRDNNIQIGGAPTGRFSLVYNLFSSGGKYIALCDGDDYWTDSLKLQKQVDFLNENQEYSATYHECNTLEIINGNEVFKEKWISYHSHSKEELLLGKGELITNTVLFKNDLPDFSFQTEILNFDTFLWHCLGFKGAARFIENVKPSIYRIHNGGMWTSKNQRMKDILAYKTYRLIYRNLKQFNYDTSHVKFLKNSFLKSYLVSFLKNKTS